MTSKTTNKCKHHPLNIIAECRRYNIPLWQCPNFLILPIGIINIIALIGSYYIANRYTSPEAVICIVIIIELLFMIISYLIIQGFEKLAESNRLKSEFVSIASHQLRTPLTGIKWAINLITDSQKLDPEQKEKIETIKENNNRMIDLINDLLSVSRIEQSRLNLDLQKINLQKIIKEIVKEYKLIAKANNIEIDIKSSKNLPLANADPEKLKIVIHNLIDNAIRYSLKKGTITIRIKQKRNHLKCEIEDEGVGIPEKDQDKIFKKFFRSENVMKYKAEGTGLGLFIAKSIIKRMNGKINFESKENKGSTFWFTLPIKK